MLAVAVLASILKLGPFFQSGPDDYLALRPFYAHEGQVDDVLWPVFTSHRDWWRFCFFVSYMEGRNDGYDFQIIPLWFNGRTRGDESYWGLFPLWGHHPHILLMDDWDFALWPVWMRYRTPRGRDGQVEKTCVCWPFVSWRDDGYSWGVWPLYGRGLQRESRHQYALWPIVTWAEYDADRDTAGAGSSWMVWPLWASVDRERERQTMFLPPLFSWTETDSASGGGWRLRCPWPLVEVERFPDHDRTSVFPFWEHRTDRSFSGGRREYEVTRYLWKLVELYDDEVRVFPFWSKKKDGSHFRLWPFYEEQAVERHGFVKWRGVLALFPIQWVANVDRNWSQFWTFYEAVEYPSCTDHYLFWGLVHWRSYVR